MGSPRLGDPSARSTVERSPQPRYAIWVAIEGAACLPEPESPADQSDPYCICEVPGKPRSRVMTDVRNATCEPVWNYHTEVQDFAVGDMLEFSVFGRQRWPRKDELLGRALLVSSEFFPKGFGGDVPLLPPSSEHHEAEEWRGHGHGHRRASERQATVRLQIRVHGGLGCGPLGAACGGPLAATRADEDLGHFAEALPAQGEEACEERGGGVAEEQLAGHEAHLRDGELLFALLDRDSVGELGRRDARAWLRTLGWCFDDAHLDSILDEARVGNSDLSPRVVSPRNPGGGPRWCLAELMGAAGAHREDCGPDPSAVQAAFRLLAGPMDIGQDASRETLRSQATRFEKEGGLSPDDFDELLLLCGVPLTAKKVPLDSVVATMVETICHPKAQTMGYGSRVPGNRWRTPTPAGRH